MLNTKYHKLAQNRFLKGNERKNGGFENGQNEHFKSYHLNGQFFREISVGFFFANNILTVNCINL